MDCVDEILIPPWTRLFLVFRRIALETVAAVLTVQAHFPEHEQIPETVRHYTVSEVLKGLISNSGTYANQIVMEVWSTTFK